MYRLAYSNDTEYRLISKSQGAIVIEEPINFEDGNGNIYERDDKSKGFLRSRSNDLEFHNTGFDFLKKQFYTKGVAEDVILRKYVKSDTRLDQKWRLATENFIDLETLELDESKSETGVAKAKLGEGGLKKIIDAKLSDKYDLTNISAIGGIALPPLSTKWVTLDSRDLFLKSVLYVDDEATYKKPFGPFHWATPIPFRIDKNSDSENIDYAFGTKLDMNGSGDYVNLGLGNIGACFMTSVTEDKTIKINGTVEIKFSPTSSAGTCRIDVVQYEGGSDFTFKTHTTLATTGISPNQVFSHTINDFEVSLKKFDSLAMSIKFGGLLENEIIFQNTEISISEDSSFPQTTARAITYFDCLERLLALATGEEGLLKSDLLTTGELSEDLITTGYWIRGFPDVVFEGTDEERKIQFSTSFKDLLDHLNLKVPIAWWVEFYNGKEYMYVETLKSTQGNSVGVEYAETTTGFDGAERLNYIEADEVKRKVLNKNFFSSIVIGSKKGGDGYEEVFGLQSICGKAEFGTINKNSKQKYEVLSPYRLSDIDIELPRRKQFEDYSETDTKYDSDIMVIACKKVGLGYQVKKWQDVFAAAPSGLYAVESAYNLEHTPARFLLAHSYIINAGLFQYPYGEIVFESSNCNSAFSSQKIGELIPIAEDGNIPHELLEKPRIKPMQVSLNLPVSQEIEDRILGIKNGKKNWFNLVAVKIKGRIEYFRLKKVDTNKEGNHTLVEANL